MAELKTQPNDSDVGAFLATVDDEVRRRDAIAMNELMKRLSDEEPRMWGTSIVGFGQHTYANASGATNDWFKIGFSPRKQSLTLYMMDGAERQWDLLGKLGPHTTGKACLYIKDLERVDLRVLEEMITRSLAELG